MVKLREYSNDRHSGKGEKYRYHKFNDQTSNNGIRKPALTRSVQIDVLEQYWKHNNS
jgi:hypothetical protein